MIGPSRSVPGYRPALALLLPAVIGVGLLSRALPLGLAVWDKYLGDSLYAVAFYLGLGLLLGSGRLRSKLALTLLYVTSIEVFQLTDIPLRLTQSVEPLVRLLARGVLGSTFSWWDLLAYAAGIAAIAPLDRWLSPQSVSIG